MTKAETGEVIERCKHLIITANSDYLIVKAINNERGLAPRRVREYLKIAHAQLAEQAYPDINTERGKAIKRYEMLIKECIKAKQYKTAAQCQEKLDNILGLLAATKHLHEHKGEVGLVWNETKTYEEPPISYIDEE